MQDEDASTAKASAPGVSEQGVRLKRFNSLMNIKIKCGFVEESSNENPHLRTVCDPYDAT